MSTFRSLGSSLCFCTALAACGGSGNPANEAANEAAIASLSPARVSQLSNCSALAASFSAMGTTLDSVMLKAAGDVSIVLADGATPMPEHCLVLGRMNPRTSSVDGKAYAIGFEMRLPKDWNGRFFYQANAGLDGTVVPAYGDLLGGSPRSNALLQGFAVLSSDAGHSIDRSLPAGFGAASFGIDPQARLDFGYNAVAQLTPMAKSLIKAAYGRGPDRSYMVGTSNGGRHGLVAASRFASDYDGILAGSPGLDLPKVGLARIWDSQAFGAIAPKGSDGRPIIGAAFSDADLAAVARKILEKCDALDGVADGMVHDLAQCQSRFSLAADVPTCVASPDGTCLTVAQKTALAKVFGGPKNSAGKSLYADYPFDAGISAPGWRSIRLGTPPALSDGLTRGISSAFVFASPPVALSVLPNVGALLDWVLNFNFDTDAPAIEATSGIYSESSTSFMGPPDSTVLSTLRNRGGKVIVTVGGSDSMSTNRFVTWIQALNSSHSGDASGFARVFLIPGMNHSTGGPATDQFDLVAPLVDWVEKGIPPEGAVATSRTALLNPGIGNIPPGRTRPLCAWPKVARYNGSGNIESAASFSCQ